MTHTNGRCNQKLWQQLFVFLSRLNRSSWYFDRANWNTHKVRVVTICLEERKETKQINHNFVDLVAFAWFNGHEKNPKEFLLDENSSSSMCNYNTIIMQQTSQDNNDSIVKINQIALST
jgi:hypothetical protein